MVESIVAVWQFNMISYKNCWSLREGTTILLRSKLSYRLMSTLSKAEKAHGRVQNHSMACLVTGKYVTLYVTYHSAQWGYSR